MIASCPFIASTITLASEIIVSSLQPLSLARNRASKTAANSASIGSWTKPTLPHFVVMILKKLIEASSTGF
uniref:Uncharacterized protein n=1 Tax=Nelumbo nucifera TaxID=4432 RepID=A0A822Z7U6_NELNU|nr:TPA_asm: hypothetical protein HUJ06_015249 [Nelumbo nucifera]